MSAESLRRDARSAATYLLPLYEMARMRAGNSPRRGAAGEFAGDSADSTVRWVNLFTHTRRLLGPHDQEVVSPNNDTLYSNAWIDLSAGPILLQVPASGDRYYVLGLLDAYSNPFEHLGTRTRGNGAARYVLHLAGQDVSGFLGAEAITCPTPDLWIIGRVLVDGEADLAAATLFQDGISLSDMHGDSAQRRFDTGMTLSERPADARRFVDVAVRMLLQNPPPPAEFEWEEFIYGDGATLDCAQWQDGLDHALALARLPREATLGNGWSLPVAVSSSFGTDYETRAHVALQYIGTLGREEAMYVIADRDGEGRLLDGSHAYALEFLAGCLPICTSFWSITLYDAYSRMLVANTAARYSIGDRTPGLRFGVDGALRIDISAGEPNRGCSNWLPAPPGRFYLMLRLYGPGAAHLDRNFNYPALVRHHSQLETQ